MFIDNLSVNELANIYLGLFGLSVLVYAVLDGYDLGVGILFPIHNESARDTMIASIGPYWDANETWLVLAVGLLLIAFPAAHSQILQALYLPATVMLAGLILRGVAFDFRAKVSPENKRNWDITFKVGSLISSLAQGYMLGMYVTGLQDTALAHTFGILAALGVTAAYVFIGACWLIIKTDGELQNTAFRWAKFGVFVLLLGIASVSLVNLALHENVRQLWLDSFYSPILLMLPIVCFALLGLCYLVLRTMQAQSTKVAEWLPFFIGLCVFVLSFTGLAMSYYPYIIPGQLLVIDALSAETSLKFLLVGALIVVPCILAYTFMVYRIFRGKADQLAYY